MARVGYGPQGKTFIERHTGREIVNLVATLRIGRPAAEVADDALDRAGIPSRQRDVRALDVEEVRRVAFACAIAGDPELIVLDDPWEFPETIAEIERARARGAAVLVATDEPGGFAVLLGGTIRARRRCSSVIARIIRLSRYELAVLVRRRWTCGRLSRPASSSSQSRPSPSAVRRTGPSPMISGPRPRRCCWLAA